MQKAAKLARKPAKKGKRGQKKPVHTHNKALPKKHGKKHGKK